MAVTTRLLYRPGPSSREVSVVGIFAFGITRVADTVITLPLLAAYPSGEANVIARQLAATFGLAGYAFLSLLSIPICALLIETLATVDWPRGSRGRWSEATVKAIAYGWISLLSLAATVHNVTSLAVLLGVVFA
ncbi:MAG: hypothetical protein U5J98_06830 [Halobacteriales archaeon]|nr:hypothetical protein [Halobacteriales archaeon]